MATKKTTTKAASAKSSAKKPKTTKSSTTTVTRVTATETTKQVTPTKAVVKLPRTAKLDAKMPENLVNILIAELIGTFVLTIVALFAASILAPLYVGLALAAIVFMIGAVSGAHVNPAITFGLWSMRKLQTVLVPFYWAAQFLGAMAAVVLIGALANSPMALDFSHFTTFSWSIFALELVGSAVFMFGVAAVAGRSKLSSGGKAFGVGMALMAGLLVSGALLPHVQNAAIVKQTEATETQATEPSKDTPRYPHEVYAGGATLNPAVALVVTEKTDSQIGSGAPVAQKEEKTYTRLSLEVIAGTLIGAALGGNLFLLVHYRAKLED
ncbi:MAG: aquaporin [Candidatus Saccharibacteria bacterium]|nr:aquaporin [Candidatus Saccharibacteria bacterium]